MKENEITELAPTSEEPSATVGAEVTEAEAEEIAPAPEESEPSEEIREAQSSEQFAKMDGLEKYYLLRRLGFSHEEAAVVTGSVTRGKGHVRSAVAATSKSPAGAMPTRELTEARELFGDLTDAQIQNLYKKVTK